MVFVIEDFQLLCYSLTY